ncbi:MAG: NAD-dependent epimerase/dehydratase family protein [Merismopedia sp. SIO2A8]|nr:NAD-dependent epimerase/dehydratase family protein [Merismopedia sp. SIO2A8]
MTKFCLVTGGLGFIGQHLVTLLLERGARVRILDLAEPQTRIEGVEYVTGSITDRPTVHSAMQGIDRVFHLAANAGLWSPRKQDFITINQTGTRTIMAEAMAANVEKVVHCSTESILKSVRRNGEKNMRHSSSQSDHQSSYPPNHQSDSQFGQNSPPIPTDESVHLTLEDMAGAYCRGKFVAEQEAFAAAKQGLPVVIVNPTVPIGPGDRRITPPTRMMLGFLNGTYPAYLNSTLNLIDARDVALGHLLAADKGDVGTRYILGHVNLQLGDLLQHLEAITGFPMPKRQVPYWLAYSVSFVQEFLADYVTKQAPAAPLTGVKLARSPMVFDNTKAKVELGLTLRPLEQSLQDAVADYQNRGLLTRPLPV